MATTIEDLEKRVAALERELRYLRQELGIWTPGEMPQETAESQAAVEAAWARVKEQLGLHGEPIGRRHCRNRCSPAVSSPRKTSSVEESLRCARNRPQCTSSFLMPVPL